MDILNIASQWAKNEIFSSKFFILAALIFIALGVGFWQLGHSSLAKAYIYPLLICGALLLIIGVGLTFNNYRRLNAFPEAFHNNPTEFVDSEIERADNTEKSSYRIIYTTIPILIVIAALLMIFVKSPTVRASCITAIAMLVILLIVDSNSHSRIATYRDALIDYQSNGNNITKQ